MERSYADFYERSRWQRARGAFKKAGVWLWGALGLGAILGGYAVAVVSEIAPAPRVARELVCHWREWRAEPAPGTHFTILISNLAGDGDGSQTNRVRDVFLGQRGLDVRSTCRVVALDPTGGSVADAEAGALAEGRTLLEDRNADLLIWGEIKKADQELSLWFLSAGSSTLGAPSYSLTEKVTVPEDFQADLGAQLEAVALSQIAPATEQAGTYLVGLLMPVRAKLERLVASPPPGLSDEQKTRLRFALALAASTIGRQGGEDEPLEAAVDSYREILDVWTRERVPLDWARAQSGLGIALQTLGDREDGTARLEQAVAAYRGALEVRTRERVPLAWASVQNNLGTALVRLGEREDGTARLEEAVEAFRTALEIQTRERAPLHWATTQSNLGTALNTLGAREDGTERLEQAVEAFRAALEIQTRERVPLHWATTQYSLGIALQVLGEREDGTARLEQAVEAFRAALEIQTREHVPLDWAFTQFDLGNTLNKLGEREDGTARLEQAVAAYRAALEVRTRERFPLDWAMTQNNLGSALRKLGEREDGTARLEEAVQAFRAALELFHAAGASQHFMIPLANLVRAEVLLAERRGVSAAE